MKQTITRLILYFCILCICMLCTNAFAVSEKYSKVPNNICKVLLRISFEGRKNPVMPHYPAALFTDLIGIYEHILYVYPIQNSDNIESEIYLYQKNETCVFSTMIVQNGDVQLVNLPSSLSGELIIYYYADGVKYRGLIDL